MPKRLSMVVGTRPRRGCSCSYAHESDEHDDAVRDLWVLLRARGVDAVLDTPAAERRQDWPLWMADELRGCDYVVVVCSPEYRRRAEGRTAADEGRGVPYEAFLIREMLYRDRDRWFGRILPVLLPGRGPDDVPDWLGPYSPSSPPTAEDHLARVGHALRGALFDDATVRHLTALMDSSFGTAVDVVVEPDEATVGLPYELLRLPVPDSRVLATTPGVSFVRRVGGDGRTAEPPRAGPLKILAAVAAPEETRTANVPLDVEAEMQAVLAVAGDLDRVSDAQVTILEVAGPEQIAHALAADSYHVLHLSAHGSSAWVELEDEDGGPVRVDAGRLVDALRAEGRPAPLVVLSSCSSAAGGSDGLAAVLVRRGADRVVAMQTSVTDRYATALATIFYRELADHPVMPVASAGGGAADHGRPAAGGGTPHRRLRH
jgi:hypothetical protein